MKRKFKRAVLHFGGDKTGSTAIQAALNDSRQMLLDMGAVAYPPGQWHAQLGSVFCTSPAQYIYNSLKGNGDDIQLRRDDELYLSNINNWIESAPPCDTIVFSYEGFCSLDKDALIRFRSFCEEIADIVTIVLYARPPFSYAVSAMSQRVKQGFPAWPDGKPPIFPFKHYLKNILAAFGEKDIQIRKFTPEDLKNGDIVADFMEVLNLPDGFELPIHSKSANESLSWAGLCVGEILINAFSSRKVAFNHEQFHIEVGQYLSSIPGERLRLNPVQAAELLAATTVHTKYLESQFGLVINEDINRYCGSISKESANYSEFQKSLRTVLADIENHSQHLITDSVAPEFIFIAGRLTGSDTIETGQSACFDIEFALTCSVEDLEVGLNICDGLGCCAFGTNTKLMNYSIPRVECGTHRIRLYLVADLPQGQYSAGFSFSARREGRDMRLASYKKLVIFQVTETEKKEHLGYSDLPCEFDFQQMSDQVSGLIEDAAGTLVVDTILGNVVVGESFGLQARLINCANQTWLNNSSKPIMLSYHWLDMEGNVVVFDGERTQLPVAEVSRGQELAVNLRVLAQRQPGQYQLQILPMQEGVCWFDEKGFTPALYKVDIVASNATRYYPGADIRLYSQTGKRDGSDLESLGKAGFLMFGPYAQLPTGNYIARIKGQCGLIPDGMWCDAVRDKGAQVLSRQEIGAVHGAGVIAELAFQIDRPVDDMEVRIWCPADAQVRIEALSIEPVESV